MKIELQQWLRVADPFPRFIGTPSQVLCKSVEDFEEFYDRYSKDESAAYARIFSEKQIAEQNYDTILIDIDYSLPIAALVARHIGKKLRTYTSGRGHHLFIDFPSIHLPNYSKVVRRYVIEDLNLQEAVKDKIVDPSVLGDCHRIARLPFSFNAKTRKRAGPITIEGITNFEDPINEDVATRLLEIQAELSEISTQNEVVQIVIPEVEDYPPCIKMCIDILKRGGDLPHNAWILLGCFYTTIGKQDELRSIVKQSGHYVPEDFEYRIAYMRENEYRSPSCKKIGASWNLCPMTNQHDCRYFPWITAKLKK